MSIPLNFDPDWNVSDKCDGHNSTERAPAMLYEEPSGSDPIALIVSEIPSVVIFCE
jgi:hypothetical protein